MCADLVKGERPSVLCDRFKRFNNNLLDPSTHSSGRHFLNHRLSLMLNKQPSAPLSHFRGSSELVVMAKCSHRTEIVILSTRAS